MEPPGSEEEKYGGVMRRVVLVTSVLLAMGVANAGPMSLTDTVGDTANFASDGLYFLPSGTSPGIAPPFYRYGYQDWGWNQAVTYLADPSPDASGVRTLMSATLTINAWQADETDQIIADGIVLGNLQKPPAGLPNQWTTTTFTLSPAALASLEDGLSNMHIDIDNGGSGGEGVILSQSALSVTYKWDWTEPDQQPPAVPAPGAVVLAGLGTALIGWLKRRQSI
jgi:hypothetical protein